MFPALRPILNKGGAGRYISRQESVERLVPVAQRHLDLLYAYDSAVGALADSPAWLPFHDVALPNLRTEVSKMSETILSLGGTPPSGVDREPALPARGDDRAVVQRLLDAEKDFGAALRHEADEVHHQERTRAILGHNADASTSRIDLLRGVLANLPG